MSICLVRVYADISRWWPCDAAGKAVSVNSIFEQFKGTPNELTRYTLTRALEGKLEKGDFDNLVKLTRICSELSGQSVGLEDLLVIED